jgi:Sigma-70 factor, region 1.2
MALEIDGLVREERVRSTSESQDTLIDLLGVEVGGIASDHEAESDDFDGQDKEPDAVARPQAGQNGSARTVTGDPTSAGAATAATDTTPREPSFSRDLVDTYFRQMGHAELLTREQEIALAKRIEAAQVGVLKSLCRVPMLVARIEAWGRELRNGGLAPGDLIDLSLSHPHAAAHDPTMAIAGTSDVPASPLVSHIMDEDANGAAEREATLLAETNSRLKRISTLASKIATLSQKRVAGSSRGLTKSEQADRALTLWSRACRFTRTALLPWSRSWNGSSRRFDASSRNSCSWPRPAASGGRTCSTAVSAGSSKPLGFRQKARGASRAGSCSYSVIPFG